MWRIARLREISDTSPLTKFNIVGFYADDEPKKNYETAIVLATRTAVRACRHSWKLFCFYRKMYVYDNTCFADASAIGVTRGLFRFFANLNDYKDARIAG